MNHFEEDKRMNENEATAQTGDGIDRRNFLGCMAWAGTGLLWSMVGGVPTSKLLAQTTKGGVKRVAKSEDFSFVQISDSHIGFNKGANPNVTGTLTKAIDRVNLVQVEMKAPDFTDTNPAYSCAPFALAAVSLNSNLNAAKRSLHLLVAASRNI